MRPELDAYYLNQEEPNRGCMLALRALILGSETLVSETRKWGMPCFCYQKKPCCYLWTDKKTEQPYLLFVEGNHLNHPSLEAGNRSKMKIFRVDPSSDLPIKTIQNLLKDALDLYRNGIIKLK